MRSRARFGIVVAVAALAVGTAVVHHKLLRWKRFDVVTPGVLYRSGSLRDWQLRRAIDEYRIKTVFSFTHTNDEAEQRLCDEAGVRRYYCYLHGNGVGPDDPYLRFLQVVQDPSSHPLLVHCSAGVQRTGGGVALYRTLLQDWTFDDAITEMIEKGNKGRQDQIDQLRRVHARFAEARVADRSGERNR